MKLSSDYFMKKYTINFTQPSSIVHRLANGLPTSRSNLDNNRSTDGSRHEAQAVLPGAQA
ncbi:hypothetical protein [Pseudomonas sp. PA27(2017)]|uniref:hypothetical protein n=1 Tax=Pseudomonas sp. PA27(2017) TaxID=1932112 RepID=UPI001C48E96B|nr:hypothetical protein [Pseudomonas sp. PA27(2017)]